MNALTKSEEGEQSADFYRWILADSNRSEEDKNRAREELAKLPEEEEIVIHDTPPIEKTCEEIAQEIIDRETGRKYGTCPWCGITAKLKLVGIHCIDQTAELWLCPMCSYNPDTVEKFMSKRGYIAV